MAGAFAKVLDTVLTYGGRDLDQHEVAALAGVADGTVSKGRKGVDGRGPLLLPAPVGFAPQMGLVLACSVGSESVRAGIVDANGVVHKPRSASPMRDQLLAGPDDLLQRVRVQAVRSLEDAFDDGDLVVSGNTLPLIGAALALPAPVDRDHRLRGNALKHEDWGRATPVGEAPSTVSLNDRFAAALGAPFEAATAQVMNDCNAAALATAFERVRVTDPPRSNDDEPRRERTTAMVLRVSGGVGLGMIEVAGDSPEPHVSRFLKSRVMVGTNGLAGEIGHLPISLSAIERINEASKDFDGLAPLDWNRQCSCGKPHHLQALVGWHALCDRLGITLTAPDATLTETLEPLLNPPEGEENQAASRALEDAGKIVARALTGPVLALDPHSITVIGALASRSFLSGIKDASGDWAKAFWTGRQVAFAPPVHGSKFMALRGAGLALLRAHRHRKLREIGAGAWDSLTPDVSYNRRHLNALKRAAGV